MTKQDKIHLFKECKVRTLWDDEQEKRYLVTATQNGLHNSLHKIVKVHLD